MKELSDLEIADAIVSVLGDSRWEAVALSEGFLALAKGNSDETVARTMYEKGIASLKKSRETVVTLKSESLTSHFTPRKKTGSAENPITKLFPAAITEQRFIEILDELESQRPSLSYRDDRQDGHSLVDFTIIEGDAELPINVKNAGTRFENALKLVKINADDCIPIPAYKANEALEEEPNLLYAVAVDYGLLETLRANLISQFSVSERVVWGILNFYTGSRVKDAEDKFVYGLTKKHWEQLRLIVSPQPFHIVSARKTIRVMQTKPYRTPGIGLKAWGTGASAEVNVHLAISEDTTPWIAVKDRITTKGVNNILEAVNRKKVEVIYDPEI